MKLIMAILCLVTAIAVLSGANATTQELGRMQAFWALIIMFTIWFSSWLK